ncbi:MAG: aspartate kinase, partial [Actinobacteria bacterium]|nr:aspartate kinase [Actinomycetota bacterium]
MKTKREIIVMKFGGTSVGTTDKIKKVAEKVIIAKQREKDVTVVVSAMGHTTDELIDLAMKVTENPDRREMDMLLSTGEQVSIALL